MAVFNNQFRKPEEVVSSSAGLAATVPYFILFTFGNFFGRRCCLISVSCYITKKKLRFHTSLCYTLFFSNLCETAVFTVNLLKMQLMWK